MNPGQVAYEAYCDKRGWVSFNGDRLPQWDRVNPEIQEAWDYAAMSVILLQSGGEGDAGSDSF